MSLPRIVVFPLLLAVALHGGFAIAGRTCADSKPLTLDTIDRSMSLALRTRDALEKSGAKVVVIARAGQDLSKYGLLYSHLGFAYRITNGDGEPVWRILHKLNQCGTSESAIYRQGLGEFYLDDLWKYESAWVVPTDDVQQKLLRLLTATERAVALHQKTYSMVAYVWGTKYQQSNQWATESMALALSDDLAEAANPSRQQAQSWLQLKGYQPSILKIDALTRLGARITAANVAFDDHPNEKRYSDRIETVTVDSVFAWMRQAGLTQQPLVTMH